MRTFKGASASAMGALRKTATMSESASDRVYVGREPVNGVNDILLNRFDRYEPSNPDQLSWLSQLSRGY